VIYLYKAAIANRRSAFHSDTCALVVTNILLVYYAKHYFQTCMTIKLPDNVYKHKTSIVYKYYQQWYKRAL